MARFSDDQLRAMYAGQVGNATARRYAKVWARIFGLGLAPRRWVTLEVRGRVSGRATRFPVGLGQHDGQWYLVSMLGNDCNWVKNLRAAHLHAVIIHGRRHECDFVDVDPTQRAALLKAYLQQVPGARTHVPVSKDAPESDFASITSTYPVFRLVSGY